MSTSSVSSSSTSSSTGLTLSSLSGSNTMQVTGLASGLDTNQIIVQARRRDERLQDVPLVINAVTSETLSKLNIRDFKDITTVVPGLSLMIGKSSLPGTGLLADYGSGFKTKLDSAIRFPIRQADTSA